MLMVPKKNYPITTDNVNNVGGKDIILKRMVNHYTALTKIKSKINNSKPFELNKNNRHPQGMYQLVKYREEYLNVRETYKRVSSAKSIVDSKKPQTLNHKPKNKYNSCKEKYEKTEHMRTLRAMSQRILSIGKPHERKRNPLDPIENPSYFFKNPNMKDNEREQITKLISLKELNEKILKLNNDERNKLLLSNAVYNEIKKDGKSKNKKRANSAVPKSYKDNNNFKVDIDPSKYIQIHLKNRNIASGKDFDKNTSNKKLVNNNLQYPIYNGNNAQFEKEITQFIINNNIASDSDFDCFENELLNRNKDNSNLNPNLVKSILQKIKDALDEDDDY